MLPSNTRSQTSGRPCADFGDGATLLALAFASRRPAPVAQPTTAWAARAVAPGRRWRHGGKGGGPAAAPLADGGSAGGSTGGSTGGSRWQPAAPAVRWRHGGTLAALAGWRHRRRRGGTGGTWRPGGGTAAPASGGARRRRRSRRRWRHRWRGPGDGGLHRHAGGDRRPALKKTTITGLPGGVQAGQVIGVPGETRIYIVGHKDGNIYVIRHGMRDRAAGGEGAQVAVATGGNNEQGLLVDGLPPELRQQQALLPVLHGGGRRRHHHRRVRADRADRGDQEGQPPQPRRVGPFHNGGSIYFNPKDPKPFLYLSVGDTKSRAGAAGSPRGPTAASSRSTWRSQDGQPRPTTTSATRTA